MSKAASHTERVRRVPRSVLWLVVVVVVVSPSLVAVAGSAQAVVAGFTATGHPNPAHDASACLTRPAGTLCIRAAEDSILPGPGLGGQGPSKHDPVTQYKWLLNKDNTGGVTLGSDGLTPTAAEVKKCHPITSTFRGGNKFYPNAIDGTGGPILADGSPNPGACNWPSIHNITSSPVVSNGTQVDWNPVSPIPLFDSATGRGLKDGKYLVSVTANGYQISGARFDVKGGNFSGLDATPSGAVVVSLNPLPIPLTNIRLKVYGDMASTNAQWDEQSEFGLPGYNAHLTDFDGPINVDYYNNPLCTAYQLEPAYDRSGHPSPTDSFYQVKLGLDGRPIVDPNHHVRGNFEVTGPATGRCTSDAAGNILIPNMAPNRYGSSVIADQSGGTDPVSGRFIPAQQTCAVLGKTPGAATSAVQSQACWVQTTTLEGNHDFDTWPQANSTGYDTELLVGGELVPSVQFGFVRAGCMADRAKGTVDYQGLTDPAKWLAPSDPRCAKVAAAPGAPVATGAIKGKIMGAAAYYPGLGGLPGAAGNAGTAGYKFDRPVKHPWVTLSDLNNGDKTIWAANANLDGTFQIAGVPDGSYSVAVWDQMQDYIFDSFNVTVAGGKVVDLGVVPLLEWWTRISGHICVDTNGNGRCDPGEAPVPHFLVQNLNRTNNAQEGGQNTFVTDQTGRYEFTEAYPLGYNDVIQAFNTRWKTTGMTWQGCNDPQEHTTLTAAVDVQYNPVIAQCGRLDWAVQPYKGASAARNDPNKPVARLDNGGIVATVLYDAVRNRNRGRTQIQYDYFTGIPGVQTELFQPVKAPDTAPATQTCGTATAPNTSYNHYFLNCDGSYRTTGASGGYTTTYAGGAVSATDRFGGSNPPSSTVNTYASEHYARATGCVARDANGKIISGSLSSSGNVVGTLPNGNTVTDFLPGVTVDTASSNPGHYSQACIEAPASAVNFGLGTDNLPLDPKVTGGPTHGSQTVDGNFALTPTNTDGTPATGDFLAKVDIPGDMVLPQPTPGVDRPLFKIADETSANNFAGAGLAAFTPDLGTGDPSADGHATTPQFVPQNADLTQVFNPDGTSHTNLGSSCPVSGGASTGTCVAFSFPPQAGPPTQTPVAVPVTGGDSPTSLVEDPNTASPSPDPQCAGSQFTVNVTDPGYQSVGGSPLEGQSRNACDVHLIHVGSGQSVAPNFYLYTDVPIPTTFVVQNFDDTNLSTNKAETQYGDAAPIPNSPEGVYDWHGNLVNQMNIDPNGIAEALMPSTDVANCATPTGICQNVYRFVGNDPGTIDHPNSNYNPQFQTITANFQAMPGVFTPADTAPTRSAISFLNGGQKFSAAAQCSVAVGSPQLFSVDRPYTDYGAHSPDVVIKGLGFGATQGGGTVLLSGSGLSTVTAGISSWTDTEIHATIPPATGGGKYQLSVTNSAKITTINGISYHVIRGSYTPAVLEVGPTFTTEPTDQAGWQAQRTFPSIQEAVERAAGYWLKPTNGNLVYTQIPDTQLKNALVVVYPAADTVQSPPNSAASSGVWFEPVILHSAVTVQGVGPGGVIPATATTPAVSVHGTVVDGRYYFSLTDSTVTPPAALDWSTAPQDVRAQHGVDVWQDIAGTLFPKTPGADNKLITEGQNVTVLAQTDQPEYSASAHPSLDGFGVQAAVTINSPTNVNATTGQRTGPAAGADATQGGALFLNGHADWTQITNNVIDGNSGSYGAIRIGSPQLDHQHNWNVDFGNNQVIANGGNNLGGGMAIFTDAGGYNVHDNVICGNQSAEYGGGMSQYGLSIAPVPFTGTLDSGGTTLTWTGAPAGSPQTFPFSAGDVGRSVAGDGLKGATVVSVDTGAHSVTLSGSNDATAFHGSFSYIPSAARFQSSSNVISHNVVKLNQSQDEGGGIMIAGQLPADSTKPSQGSGPVTITGNKVAVNIANDDGGGIRFLQAGNFPIRVENNNITNNVSSHEGGGIALDDTSQATIINNTIAKNITTATAVTSNGTPAPAGISTAHNSDPFQASLPAGSPIWSNPIIANDLIYDNRAGSWNASTSNVSGIGQIGDSTPLNVWDVGIADPGAGLLSPIHSVLSTPPNMAGGEGYLSPMPAGNRVTAAPTAVSVSANAAGFTAPFNLQLDIAPMRINFRFRVTAIVNIGLPTDAIGDYHIGTSSPANALGVSQLVPADITRPFIGPIFAPTFDIDGIPRFNQALGVPPLTTLIDAGAAQIHRP